MRFNGGRSQAADAKPEVELRHQRPELLTKRIRDRVEDTKEGLMYLENSIWGHRGSG